MKIGDTVWIPDLKSYGKIHELNWDKKLIKTVEVKDPITGILRIINVIHMAVEAVNIIERIIIEIISFFRKKSTT